MQRAKEGIQRTLASSDARLMRQGDENRDLISELDKSIKGARLASMQVSSKSKSKSKCVLGLGLWLLLYIGGVWFIWSGASDSSSVLLPYPLTSLASPMKCQYTDIYSKTTTFVLFIYTPFCRR